MIKAKRLHILPVVRQHVEAFQQGLPELGTLLGVTVPADWPQFPQAFSPPSNDDVVQVAEMPHWFGYFFINAADNALIGNGGYKGPPTADGLVEIGYEIAPQYWNQGYASEAAAAMVQHAFTGSDVSGVAAHTLGVTNASNRVLQKVGMEFVAEAEHPKFGLLWSWVITREKFLASH